VDSCRPCDLLRAAVPGPTVMLSIPLKISPEAFFGASNVFLLHAPPNGTQRLSQFLWDYLTIDETGTIHRIATGSYPQSVFYASTGTYNLGHTCNTWTAEALRVADLPVSATGGFRWSGPPPASINSGGGTGAHPQQTLTLRLLYHLWSRSERTGRAGRIAPHPLGGVALRCGYRRVSDCKRTQCAKTGWNQTGSLGAR
jgi:hypothetical protein